MKNILNYTFLLAATLLMGSLFTACGSDDEEEKNNMIVGTWTEPYNETTSVLKLTSSGTFDFYVHGSGLTGKGNYTYDEVTRTLSLFYVPKNKWGDRVYIVRTLTDKYLVITDDYGNTHSFTKQ